MKLSTHAASSLFALIILAGCETMEPADPVKETAENGVMRIGEGPIWNQIDAETKCPALALKHNGTWTGGWSTTVPSKMSVCEIDPATAPTPAPNNQLAIVTNINFDGMGAGIRSDSEAKLNRVISILKANPSERVRVEGHTSSDGTEKDNLGLSYQRAEAVKAYLMSQGIAGNRLSVVGFGETKPLVSNRTKAGKAVNDRVEFRVLN